MMAFAGSGELSETEPANIRLSRSVLEAVRSSGDTVMASNVRLAPQQLDLTAVEDDRPRAVVCSPIESSEDAIQALYLEVSASEADQGILDFARAMARQIGFAKKAVLAANELTQRRLLDQQLAMARTIQLGLTPKLAEIPSIIDVSLHYEPAMWVGGDYCDIWQVQGRGIAFAVGDVSGKGLPAALTMANLHAALRTAVHFSSGPAEAMSYVNEHLIRHLPSDTFVTLILGMFDPDSGTLHYVNAGHILPVIMNRGTVAELGRPMNPPLGLAPVEYQGDSAVLVPGAGLIIVTDGITEACSPSGELFGVPGLLSAIRQDLSGQSQSIVQTIVGATSSFRGVHPQQDDATVLALFLQK
jgi:sigma-B regulation protein RsbU (phosphoserine phosphatase)